MELHTDLARDDQEAQRGCLQERGREPLPTGGERLVEERREPTSNAQGREEDRHAREIRGAREEGVQLKLHGGRDEEDRGEHAVAHRPESGATSAAAATIANPPNAIVGIVHAQYRAGMAS